MTDLHLSLHAHRAGAPPLRPRRWRLVPWPPMFLILAIISGVYVLTLHPWLMNWGSTPDEQRMPLPGDEVAADPTLQFTRAITIEASTAEVWPWLIQIGQDRAGFYSYTWLENLTGADIYNAWEIRPEWQHRAIGDRVPMARQDVFGGALAETTRLRIVALEPERLIANDPGRFVLQPLDEHRTRLLLRERIADQGDGAVGRTVGWLVWDPMHFVMEQRMLRGIKERAEGQRISPLGLMLAARIGWTLAGLGLLGLLLSNARWRAWTLLPAGLVAPSIVLSGDLDAALAGFLAIGITLLGALAFGRRWWPSYLLVAASVAYVLLLAPDAYVVLGLLFLAIEAGAATRLLGRIRLRLPQPTIRGAAPEREPRR